jgi:DNA-binding response OmpR family regulator
MAEAFGIRISFGFRISDFGFPLMTPPAILIIEDDDFQYEIYEEALAKFTLLRARNGSEALARIPREQPALLILDHVLSEGELGLSFLPAFKELVPFVPVIIVSGALEVQQQIKALQGPRRAHYCLAKPVDIHELKRTVQIALKECGESEVIRQFEALERSHRIDALELFSRSTDRLARQHRIRELIGKSSERPNISALAREFKVARRTIIRDLQELIRRGEVKPAVYPEWENPATEESEELPPPCGWGSMGRKA